MRGIRLLAVLFVVALVAAACTDSADTTTTTTAAPEATSANTEPPPTTAPATTPPTTPPTTSTVEAAAGTDASVATSCEELADIGIAIAQEFINGFGEGPFEDWYTNSPSLSPGVQDGIDVWMEKMGKSTQQSDSLGCDVGDAAEEQLFCDRMSQLDPLGDAGLGFLHDMVPCDLDPEDQARVDEFLNSQQ